MSLRDRIGIDLGRKIRREECIDLAAAHGVKFIDIQRDAGDNALDKWDDARCAAVLSACERPGIALGLHITSAVNVAEYAPIVADAVDAYLCRYIDDMYGKLGARGDRVKRARLAGVAVD